MADWTANSSFGALSASREPRIARGGTPKATGPRAERFGPHRPGEEPRSPAAHAALAEFNATDGGPLAKARFVVWAGGGLVSLALVAGIGVWGYKVVLREVLGLPVVVAAEGPMRIAPADPGGQVVPSQGLAVNAIPAAGTAAPPSDVLMLAPPAPDLAKEDMEVVVQTRAEEGEVLAIDAPDAPVPGSSPVGIVPSNRPLTVEEMQAFGAQVNGPAAAPAAPVEAAPLATAALPEATVIIPPPPPEAPAAVEETVANEAAPEVAATDPAPAETAAVAAAPVPTVTVIPADVPGIASAIRPFTRPVRTVALDTPAAPEAPVAEPVASAPVAVASGAALVQLGAYDSAEIATAEWDRLQSEFGEFLGGKERVIQEAQSGGRTFFRLRASGFADRADASRLCAALTAENADCIPVRAD